MMLTTGITYQQTDGNWRKITITLEDADLQLDRKALLEKFRTGFKSAESLLIAQLAREGAVTPDEAREQLAAL